MTRQIPKYSSVQWAATAVAAVIIAFILGLGFQEKTITDTNAYMITFYGVEQVDSNTKQALQDWLDQLESEDQLITSGIYGDFTESIGASSIAVRELGFAIVMVESEDEVRKIASSNPVLERNGQVKIRNVAAD